MNDNRKRRQRAVQNRAIVTRSKIANGAVHVLAHAGVAGLTHRAVARAAGVGLAATTYHFDTKSDIIEEASRTLLDGYLGAFRRMTGRIAVGEETGVRDLRDLVDRAVLNALGRERTRSLAWCELILHGGRSSGSRSIARDWYEQLDAIWYDIASLVEHAASRQRASAAVDLAIGLIFILHPLGLDQQAASDLLAGQVNLPHVLDGIARPDVTTQPDGGHDDDRSRRHAETKHSIVQAAIDIIVREGAAGISYGSVAEAAGMARSGPSYYFPTIEELLGAAQAELFERAKIRYRSGLEVSDAAGLNEGRLLDLTTSIFFREALELGSENIGYYSIWMSAAQNPSLRPAVASSLLDLHRAWSRRIAFASKGDASEAAALRMQAIFIGKLVRSITAATDISILSRAREDFAAALSGW